MRTALFSCLSPLQQGNETMADQPLVLVPHEHTHAPRSILEQARKSGPDVSEMGAKKKHYGAHRPRSCITNGAPAKVAREGRPGKTALLNGQSMGTKSELHKSPELTDAHWQLIVGFTGKRLVTRSIPDWRSYWYSACYSVLVSQAGCNGRVTSPRFFFFFIVGLKSQITTPAKPVVICAKLCPLGRGSPG